MEYRTFYSDFSSEQLEKHNKLFWAIPPRWGDDASTFLRTLRESGGAGVLSILPVLGCLASSEYSSGFFLAKEHLARLAGIDQKTVEQARVALTEQRLASARVAERHGRWLLKWTVSSELAAKNEERSESTYFYFSHQLLYGGNWAMMSATLRAIYIAAATQARTFFMEKDRYWLVEELMGQRTLPDIDLCSQRGKGIRLASVSASRLGELLGITADAIRRNLISIKHPEDWTTLTGPAAVCEYMPLRVYPTRQGSFLFHFRDHAPHWPWSILNRHDRKRLDECELPWLLQSLPDASQSPSIDLACEGVING